MEKQRRGTSISVKMILTTTTLIVVIVALFGVSNYSIMSQIFDDQRQSLEDTLIQTIRQRGSVQTRDLVQPSRTALQQNDYSTLQSFVPDIASGDREVIYAFVADNNSRIIAHSDKVNNTRAVQDPNDQEMIAAAKDAAKDAFFDKRFSTPGGDLYLFARPVIASDQQRVGTVVLAYTLRVLGEQRQKLEDEKSKAAGATLLRTVVIGLIFALLGSAVAIFQGLRISRPIQTLAWRADQLARGDLETRVEITSSDEIGTLAENFNFMADRLLVLVHETAEKATLEKEVEVARNIQETLVPSADLVDRGALKLAGHFLPASQCGGDWWTVHDLPDGRILVVIGDVTGHGVPAAMITAAAKAACDTVRAVTGGQLKVPYLLEMLNRAILESAKRKFVMTCFASIIDPKARTITYANAGHNFPYLYRPSASEETQDFQVLMSRGNRLGDVEDSTYVEKTQPLAPGDVLVWYTDGVVECENERGEEFGDKRFRAAVRRAATQDPIGMRTSVVREASDFFGERPRKDDITLVFARVYG